MTPATRRVLIFAAGGPLAVDMEESCARAGVEVAAAVQNRAGPAYTLDPTRILPVAALTGALREVSFLCPLFTPANRHGAVAEAEALGLRGAAALADPTAVLAASARLGEGCYVNAGCILGAASWLGRFVLVNRAASLGHHAIIGDFASIGPGATIAGQVEIGAGALVGAGAVVGPGLRVGIGAVLAPGTVLRRDAPPGTLVAGNPGRIVRRAQPEKEG